MVSASCVAGALGNRFDWRENYGINRLTRYGASGFFYACVRFRQNSPKLLIQNRIFMIFTANLYRNAIFIPLLLQHKLY
jgi:hypothetical protein